MRLLKNEKRFGDTTIRKVSNDRRTKIYGLVGTVGDMIKKEVIHPVSEIKNEELDKWALVWSDGNYLRVSVYDTRAEALESIEEYENVFTALELFGI